MAKVEAFQDQQVLEPPLIGAEPAALPGSAPPLGNIALVAAGSLALAACGDGGSAPPPPPPPPVPVTVKVSAVQASRFLSQGAIGHSKADLLNLADSGYEA